MNFRKIITSLYLITWVGLFILFTVECSIKQEPNPFFLGEHKLRKFNVKMNETSSWRASYFLIAGSASGGSYTETEISFSWQLNSGEYVISKIPVDQIRIKLDSTIKEPFVTFSSHYYGVEEDVIDIDGLPYMVNYMTIHCKEEDFPININIKDL